MAVVVSRLPLLIPFAILLLPASSRGAESAGSPGVERKPIIFVLSEGESSGWVRGNLSFPPSVVRLTASIRLRDFKSGVDVPGVLTASRMWFDGSVMAVEFAFRATKAQERRIWAEWGTGIRGSLKPGRIPRGAKVMEFRIFEEGDQVRMQGEVNVGTLVVRVERHAGAYYWWYLIPIAGIVGFVLWRKLKLRHG